jgi:hypothetical protein
LFHIFAYLKMKHNNWIVFDPIYPFVYEEQFKSNADWKLLYGDVKEVIPPDAPQSCGKEVVIQHYVYANHASEQITHQSCTVYITFLSMAQMHCLVL